MPSPEEEQSPEKRQSKAINKAHEDAVFWGRQLKFWLVVAILAGLILWAFRPVLLPFILGAVVAYLLNPIVGRLQNIRIGRIGMSRLMAGLVILLGFLAVVIGSLAVIVPIASAEFLALVENMPGYAAGLWAAIEPYRQYLQDRVSDQEIAQAKTALEGASGRILELSRNFLSGLIGSGQALIGLLSIMVLTPLVSFYMLLEWPRITRWVDTHIPSHHAADIRQILGEIDQKIAGFIRGQVMVAILLAVIYAVAMKIAGLHFGLAVGLMAGLLSIIPLVGSLSGFLAGTIIAYFQSYDPSYVALIAGIFIAGQILEGYILTPKLVGDQVGLHPLWMMFALMAGGALLGFAGLLVAVPVAASLGVLLSFTLARYKDSEYYSPTKYP